MSKQLMRAMNIFCEIERINEENRTVEAYAFVNEVVEGEGGLRLKRSSMEAATADYMTWANVRRMHQPDAVGVAQSVTWDERGAHMVLEVVDDDAWNKVKRGVYKGLSVGVQATLMRGKDVEKCRWIETSLVDRPKDPGAIITAVRADDFAVEYECEVEDEAAEERGVFADAYKKVEPRQMRYIAQELLSSMLYEIQGGNSATKEEDARAVIKDFANIIAPLCARGELSDPADLIRFCQLETVDFERLAGETQPAPSDDPELVNRAELTDLQTRFEALAMERDEATRNLTEVRTELQTAQARVQELLRTPAREPVAKYGQGAAIDRTFLADQRGESEAEVEELRAELKRLSGGDTEMTHAQRQAASTRISAIRRELAAFGAD